MKTLSVLSLATLIALSSSAFAQEQTQANNSTNPQAQATQNTTQEKAEPAWKKEAEKWDQQHEEMKKKGFW